MKEEFIKLLERLESILHNDILGDPLILWEIRDFQDRFTQELFLLERPKGAKLSGYARLF